MRTIDVNLLATAVDADLLAGSELEFAPGNGVYIVRAASTVNTATLALSGNRSPVQSVARLIPLRANGECRAEDEPRVLAVEQGEKIVAALAGTTGTVQTYFKYMGD